jgi:GTP cyclohydrolase II
MFNTNLKQVKSWSKTDVVIDNNGEDILCSVYCFQVNNKDEWALVYGSPQLDKYPLVRIQSQCITGIVLDHAECDCKQNLKNSKKMLMNKPNGGILYILNQDGKNHGGVSKLTELEMRRQNIPQQEIINVFHHGNWDLRSYEFIPETLKIMGLNNVIHRQLGLQHIQNRHDERDVQLYVRFVQDCSVH